MFCNFCTEVHTRKVNLHMYALDIILSKTKLRITTF